uniref:Chloroplast protein-transporting ATPase n=1 Tax=Panagrolaimus sp. JU765 TaxID=591449 RepID=A0AC34QSP0_9BILA
MAIMYAVESSKHLLEQVNTGEGKSFIIAAIAIILRKVDYRYIDIITSSPVLAKRDSEEMKPLFEKFGLTVGHNCSENPEERRKAYQCDVLYGDIAQFQRDYLLHTFYKKQLLGARVRNCVIVDEVDNMLLDNGNNMLYLSHNIPGLNLLDSLLIFIYGQVHKPMYNGMTKDLIELQAVFDDKKIRAAVLTDIFGRITLDDLEKLVSVKMNQKNTKSAAAAFDQLVANEIIDLDGFLLFHELEKIETVKNMFIDEVFKIRLSNTLKIILNRKREISLPHYLKPFVKLHLDEFIQNCKNAMFLEADNEYVVDVDRTGMESCLEPKVTIIDPNTGADLATSQWNGGLHQFLQLMHNCRLSPISLKAVFISNVAYLKGYEKITGLSGTLGSLHESQTLIDLYNADLIRIPTFQPKNFYENVAVVTPKENEWYQNLFDEVCNQISAERSVLIVAESIATVQKIALELNVRFKQLENPSSQIKICFNSIKTYQRNYEEFVFNEKNLLQPSKLLIATNLAGRGTDIKLSNTLINKGGLHVIISYLPSNRRIEEQAFGRAARCGQPGSAQIIALKVDDDGAEQSIFQLKMFRDNQEVHRLASLKSFYDFHTEIEEQCLEKFRQHCSSALTQVYSSSGINNEKKLQTPSQVVYFALLDKWALWLDEKSSLIDHCAKNPQDSEKQLIIESVEEFLKNHPFTSHESCFEVAKQWVDAPQSLITIGVIQMCHENGFEDAENTFDRILKDGNEFGAEVYYYKACMRMQDWQSTRQSLKSMTITNPEEFSTNLDEAMQFFHKSRTFFMERISRKQKEGKIVAQYCQNQNQANNSGFSSQQKTIISTYRLIVDNIDWIIGRPIREDTFVTKEIGADYGKKIYESFARQGIFSPSLINNQTLENWQLESLRHTFKLSKTDVNQMLEGMKNDSRIEVFDEYYVFNKQIMMAHIKLPHRTGFWTQMDQMEVFNHESIGLEDETTVSTNRKILVVDPRFVSELPPEFSNIKPIKLNNDSEDARYQIRLNNGEVDGVIYDWNEVANLGNDALKKINKMVFEKKIISDFMAHINLETFANIGHCERFDEITITEIAKYFEIDELTAGWILSTLIEFGVLKTQTDLFYQFNPDQTIWNTKICVYLEKETKSESLIAKNAESFDLLRKKSDLKNMSPELIQNVCNIEDNEKLIEFFKLLLDEKIIVPYGYTRFRLVGKLDCSCLPPSISYEVLKFLNDRFAYSFAIETLSYALDQSKTNPKVPKQILLPEDPYKDLEKELKRLGIVLPPRIFTKDYKDLESEDYKHFEQFAAIIHENRTKLFDNTQFHMELEPSEAFFTAREHLMDGETKAIIKNGLPMLIMPKTVSTSWKAMFAVVKFVAKAVKTIWSGIKAIGSFFYRAGASFVKTCVKPLVNKAVATLDYVAEKVMDVGKNFKEAVREVADTIAETEIYKAATETVKRVASGVGNAASAVGETVVTAADKNEVTAAVGTAVIEGAKNTDNFIAKKAGAAVDYAASTKVYQMTKDKVNRALDAAKYAYQKLSAYVTSTVESYEYYSECRIGARQIAIEQQGLVDEQAILISFNNSKVEQNRKEINDQRFLKKIGQQVTSECEKFVMKVKQEIETLINEEFKDVSLECAHKDLEALFSTGEGFKNFKSETVEHLSVFASIAKVVFYQVIREYAADEEMNLTIIPVSSIQLIGEYNCDKLYETIKDICDEIKEFAKNNPDTNVEKNLNVETLKELMTTKLGQQLDLLASSIYIKPIIQITTEYLASCRNKPQLLSMANFAKKDCELKKALTDYNMDKQSKKHSKFLKKALFEVLHQSLAGNPNNKMLYQVAFKYGYPLPMSCAKKLTVIIHQVIVHAGSISEKEQGFEDGFILKIYDPSQKDFQGKPLISISTAETAKVEVQITHSKGMIFLCESDYQTFVKNEEMPTEESTNSFFYEAIIGKLKMTASYFPKHHESFREAMIHFASEM